jgi:hypothetical protein
MLDVVLAGLKQAWQTVTAHFTILVGLSNGFGEAGSRRWRRLAPMATARADGDGSRRWRRLAPMATARADGDGSRATRLLTSRVAPARTPRRRRRPQPPASRSIRLGSLIPYLARR